MHGAVWKDRGLLTSHNSPIKYGPEIIALLEAAHKPKTEAVIHRRGRQKDTSRDSKENDPAERAAKQAAQSPQVLYVLTPGTNTAPVYSDRDIQVAPEWGFSKNAQDWFINDRGKVFTPKGNQWKLTQGIPQATHLGKKATEATKALLRETVPRFGLPLVPTK